PDPLPIVRKKCLQTQLLTSLKPLSIHTHNRNGPPFGGPFLFLFFCPRGDADMPLLPPSPDPIEGPGGEEGAPEQGGGPPPGRDMLGEVTGVGRGLYGRGNQIAGGSGRGARRHGGRGGGSEGAGGAGPPAGGDAAGDAGAAPAHRGVLHP